MAERGHGASGGRSNRTDASAARPEGKERPGARIRGRARWIDGPSAKRGTVAHRSMHGPVPHALTPSTAKKRRRLPSALNRRASRICQPIGLGSERSHARVHAAQCPLAPAGMRTTAHTERQRFRVRARRAAHRGRAHVYLQQKYGADEDAQGHDGPAGRRVVHEASGPRPASTRASSTASARWRGRAAPGGACMREPAQQSRSRAGRRRAEK